MKTKFNLENLIRENIKSLKPYSSARDEYKDATTSEMIFLDANENPFENGVNRYPDPQQGLVLKNYFQRSKILPQKTFF